jgi:ribosome biogenesis protein BRX1
MSAYKAITQTSSKKDSTKPNEAKEYRQRVLLLTSRGVTFRHRHLLNDLAALLPHARKESKLDTKTKLFQLNELAELYNCNNVMYFEARKGKDLYCWLSKPPNGPTIKFHIQNCKFLFAIANHIQLNTYLVHTMDELHFTGNCLKGSRPILSFDSTFDTLPHLQLTKELLTHIFGVPKGARKSKPFIDHVIGFTVTDGRIWYRCYQINEGSTDRPANPVPEGGDHIEDDERGGQGTTLVEIGPRFVLTPIVVLEGSFGGPVIYENKEFVSPNAIRAELRRKQAGKFNVRAQRNMESKAKKDDLGLLAGGKRLRKDPLDNSVLFA